MLETPQNISNYSVNTCGSMVPHRRNWGCESKYQIKCGRTSALSVMKGQIQPFFVTVKQRERTHEKIHWFCSLVVHVHYVTVSKTRTSCKINPILYKIDCGIFVRYVCVNYDILYMTSYLSSHGNSIKPVFCSCKACIYSAKQLFNCIMTWLNHYYKWHRAATLPYDMIEWQKIS